MNKLGFYYVPNEFGGCFQDRGNSVLSAISTDAAWDIYRAVQAIRHEARITPVIGYEQTKTALPFSIKEIVKNNPTSGSCLCNKENTCGFHLREEREK